MINNNDMFIDEVLGDSINKWKVLIVDDDKEVHSVTKLALKRFEFNGKSIQFFSAYSAAEGKKMLVENMDMAVILLDVVMEEENAGLKLAQYIRQELHNKLVRIILRTGQPGQAPEHKVIMEYDINDYKEKTELTSQKLYTTMITALRSFQDLSVINSNRYCLQKIIESSADIFQLQSLSKFTSGALTQLVDILKLAPNAVYGHISSFSATKEEFDELFVMAGTGVFKNIIGSKLRDTVSTDIWLIIEQAFSSKKSKYYSDCFVVYFCSKYGSENVMYFEGINTLSEWDRNLIEVFCVNVSIGFDNLYLNKEIEDTQKEIIFMLGEVAEARSQEMGCHVKRVAELAKLIAIKHGLSEEEAELLRLAAPIHDIGKLGIEDVILNKPGKLTEAEFAVMRKHSEIGYEMLKSSNRSILQAGALIALQHHERFDGTGYPKGLKGTEIHVFSRIVALADVFDALGNERVYKKTWQIEKIIEYISAERGKHFDPVLVDVFLENLSEILKIREDFPDRKK